MKKFFAFLLCINLLLSSLITFVCAEDLPFDDVSESDWFYPYVNTSVQIGLVNGLSDAEFGADDCITREQMAVICMRAIDKLGLSHRRKKLALVHTIQFLGRFKFASSRSNRT